MHGGRRERRGEHEPDHAEERAGAERDDEDDERVEPERRSERVGWRMFWSRPFPRRTITSMIAAVVGPSDPSASITANAPVTNADLRMYAVTNATTAIVPARARRAPTPEADTTPLRPRRS